MSDSRRSSNSSDTSLGQPLLDPDNTESLSDHQQQSPIMVVQATGPVTIQYGTQDYSVTVSPRPRLINSQQLAANNPPQLFLNHTGSGYRLVSGNVEVGIPLNPEQQFNNIVSPHHHKLNKKLLLLAAIINGTYFIQGLMAIPALLDNTPTSALATDGLIAIAARYDYVPPLICAVSTFSLNAFQSQDYLPKLVESLKALVKEPASRKKKALKYVLLLPSGGAAVASAKLGYDAFSWIPSDTLYGALNPIVSYGNCAVSFATTLATRFVGALNMVQKVEDSQNPYRQLQNALAQALRQLSSAELKELNDTVVAGIMRDNVKIFMDIKNSNRNKSESDLRELYHKEITFQVLNHLTVKAKLQPHLRTTCGDHASTATRWIAGITASLTGGSAFSQKFCDGISHIWHSFLETPYALRLIPSIIAGLPTNLLYLVHTLDGIPLMWDSMTRRTRKKIYAALLGLASVLSCASMLYVGTTVSNTKDGLYSDIIPPAADKTVQGYIYPLLLALLGPLSVNGKSAFNLLLRNPNLFDPKSEDFLFWLEQNKLSDAQVESLAATYDLTETYFPKKTMASSARTGLGLFNQRSVSPELEPLTIINSKGDSVSSIPLSPLSPLAPLFVTDNESEEPADNRSWFSKCWSRRR